MPSSIHSIILYSEFNSTTQTTHIIPLIYILLCYKKQQSYNIVFQIIKSQLPQFEPVNVHCDMELAALNALLKKNPKADTALCYIMTRRKTFGKMQNYTNTQTARQKEE